MAQCKDCDKCFHRDVCAGDTDRWNYFGECPHYINSADVVPASEVEQLKRNLEQCENGYRQEMHLLQCKLADEQSKVREIFEEIENRAFGFGACFVEMTRTTFDEIKKKYTEGEHNE